MALPSTGIIADAPALGYHGDLLGSVYDVRGGLVRTVALGGGALALYDGVGPNGEDIVRGVANGDLIAASSIAGFVLRNETFAVADYGIGRQVEVARKGRMRAVPTAGVLRGAQVYVGNVTATLGRLEGAPAIGLVPLPGARWKSTTLSTQVGVIEFSFPLQDKALQVGTLPAFAAGVIAVPANTTSGTVFDVPVTAAVSVINLPATAEEGSELTFVADGVKNGHTIQYRDVTGAVNLTAALTASKRHVVTAIHLNDIWYATAHVAP